MLYHPHHYGNRRDGGAVSPSGVMKASSGSNQTFTLTANPGLVIADLLADSWSVGKMTSYTFTNVQAVHR
ncbi:MAG: hypothetical protein NTV46_21320 [Verrucomicrobia bacterium]|nr:hypothetical protein [Verrucomicrobiota bacterium]